MNKKIIALLLILVLIVSAFAGCETANKKQERKPQLVVALNPILTYENGDNVIVFNDVKNAMSNDQNAATLTSLVDDTDLVWVYKQGEDWKKRGIYGLDKWRNGGYVSADKLQAYTFLNDGTISLMPYTTQAAKLNTYQGETPTAAGILLSVSGTEEEALGYQISQSGTIGIPAGKITAIESVGGVKTGFLAEDGTARSAVVKFIVNSRVVWSGEFCNSTAGDGTAVTELEYPDIPDIEVNEGDVFFISMKLDAEINDEDDIGSDNQEDLDDGNQEDEVTEISLMDNYDSRFRIVYSKDVTITQKQIINTMKKKMVDIFEADVRSNSDVTDEYEEVEYEILIGRTDRAESKKAYNELTSYRANNGKDFIIRMDGTKLVIAANTDYALQLALDYFMENYCKTDKDSVPSNLNYVSRPKLSTIVIDGKNIASFTIRTQKYPSLMTVKAAEALAEYIVDKTGYNLKIEKDTKTTANEILVGLTTRSGISENVFKAESLDFLFGKNGTIYNNEDYNIFVDSGKLFIETGSDYATSHAVIKLIDELQKNTTLSKTFTLKGSYSKGEYSLLGDYAYTWGDEFFTSSGTTFSKKNWKLMDKGYMEDEGCWYTKTDPYYLASKASLEDDDPSNDFGGPWVVASNPAYMQEGTSRNLAENAVIRNNVLVQTAKKSVNGYTGNVICSDGRMEFRYGILESRIMAATANGSSACFWTRTKDSGGGTVNEIDIFENFGTDSLRPNLHTWGATHIDHSKMITLRKTVVPAVGETFSDTYHHLALEWTPEYINMYLDGEIYLSQEITGDTWAAFKETTYVIFNNTSPSATYAANKPGNWLGGGDLAPMDGAKLVDTNGDGRVDVEDFYTEQSIDYVRLYQINSSKYSLKAKK